MSDILKKANSYQILFCKTLVLSSRFLARKLKPRLQQTLDNLNDKIKKKPAN